MKKRLRNDFVTADISFDDFMSNPASLGHTDKSVTELALETRSAEEAAKKKDRELKKVKRLIKKMNGPGNSWS